MANNYEQKPGLLEGLGAQVKALLGSNPIPHGNYQGGWQSGWNLGGNHSSSPGADFDYGKAAGVLLDNRVVATVVNAVGQALAEAPAILEKKNGNEWSKVEDHPVIDLLATPNPYYGSAHLWSATAGSECTSGQAFWHVVWNQAKSQPAELWWLQDARVQIEGTATEFISGYKVLSENGHWYPVPASDIIHFRHSLNPNNPRKGWAPLGAGNRQIAGDNGAASYQASLLRNSTVASMLVSVKDGVDTGQVTKEALSDFMRQFMQHLKGEGAGKSAGINLPLDVHKIGYSPDEMALDKLISYYETSICALLGVDPMVVGLGSGTTQKTYANFQEAINDFWERRIVPTNNRHDAELGAQLLPLYGLDPAQYRFSRDYSKVAPLQENEDLKHRRLREDYKAGAFDLFTYQTSLGMKPEESTKGVYFSAGGFGQAPGLPEASGVSSDGDEGESTATPLNGAQITAAIDVMAKLQLGSIGRETAIILLVKVGISRDDAAAMVDDSAGKTPVEVVAGLAGSADAEVPALNKAIQFKAIGPGSVLPGYDSDIVHDAVARATPEMQQLMLAKPKESAE